MKKVTHKTDLDKFKTLMTELNVGFEQIRGVSDEIAIKSTGRGVNGSMEVFFNQDGTFDCIDTYD